jgi:excisionase family DNA binding protein
MYSLEQIADRLGLQVRTIRAYVRSGRLQAIRIGKQYRVSRSSLDALTGSSDSELPGTSPARARRVEVSSIVQIDAASSEIASRITNLLVGAADGNRGDSGDHGHASLRVETLYDSARGSLKVMVIGGLADAAEMYKLIGAVLANP